MIEKNDWRLAKQERYLAGRTLMKIPYRRRSEDRDHDHCAFCWDKFSEHQGDLHEGYVTADDGRTWVCPECFEDFKEMFHWKLVEPQKPKK